MLRRERKIFITIIILSFFGSVLVLPNRAFCYDSNIAHSNIVALAAELYNKQLGGALSAQEINYLKQGAVEEDTPTRWLNHFYDPVHNKGLFFIKEQLSAKNWAQNPFAQTNFSLGDQSWQRALSDFNNNDKERAFKELGHVLHTIADMAVPAHTRLDIHVLPPDSYEQFVKNNWSAIAPKINSQFISSNSLNGVFDNLANYSNNNFYSDDTVNQSMYVMPNILNLKISNIKDETSGKIYSFLSDGDSKICWLSDVSTWGAVNCFVNQPIVLSSYSTHLLPQAVGYSAGVIKLFLDTAQTQKNNKTNLPTFRTGLLGYLDRAGSLVINGLEDLMNYFNPPAIAENNAGLSSAPTSAPTDSSQLTVAVDLNNQNSPQKINSSQLVASPSTQPVAPDNTTSELPTNPLSSQNNQNNSTPQPITNYSGAGGSIFTNNNSIAPFAENILTVSTPESSASTTPTPTTTPETPTSTSTPEIPPTTTSTPPTTTPEIIPPVTTTTPPTSTIPEISTPTSTPTSTEPITPTPTPTSTPPTPTPTPTTTYSQDVVFNEIAWAGTSVGTAEDEYIELYNNTDQDIVLFSTTTPSQRWRIYISGNDLSIGQIKNRVIPARGYFLFERTDDRTVNEIAADIIYSGAMKNTGEKMRLVNGDGQTIDEVDCSAGWYAGGGVNYASMERLDSKKEGSDPLNWQASLGARLQGLVDGGGDTVPLYGSPKQSNFSAVVLKSRQNETTRVLKKNSQPYILTYYEIPAGKILQIEAGAVLKSFYKDSKIDVKGELKINGAATEKVVLTSGRDNSAGGETVGSWSSSTPQAKDWQGIQFYAGAVGNLIGMDWRYAGKEFRPPGAGMWTPNVSQSLRADNASIIISNSIFNNNGDNFIYLNSATATISNTEFSNGGIAMAAPDSFADISSSKFNNFTSDKGPLQFQKIWPKLQNLTLENNAVDYLYMENAVVSADTIWDKNITYALPSLTINSGVTLTLSAGAQVRMATYGAITVNGILNINGTAEEPVRIAPISDNVKWGDLTFNNSVSALRFANISSGGIGSSGSTLVLNNNSQLILDNCQILDSRPPGNAVLSNNSVLHANNSTIGYAQKPSLKVVGIKASGGELYLNNTTFMNLDIGLQGISTPLPILSFTNTTAQNFINVATPWDPSVWFSGFSAYSPQ